MAYNKNRFRRDMRRLWKWTKPRLKDGTITPFVAALNKKKRPRAVIGLLTVVPVCLFFILSLAFFGARLALKR